jgi:hypothetical protein
MDNRALLRQAGLVDPTPSLIFARTLLSVAVGGALGTLGAFIQALATTGTFSLPALKTALIEAAAGALGAVITHYFGTPLSLVPPAGVTVAALARNIQGQKVAGHATDLPPNSDAK